MQSHVHDVDTKVQVSSPPSLLRLLACSRGRRLVSSRLLGRELEVGRVLVVRRFADRVDGPEVGRLELVCLCEGGHGGFDEVTLCGGGTFGLG